MGHEDIFFSARFQHTSPEEQARQERLNVERRILGLPTVDVPPRADYHAALRRQFDEPHQEASPHGLPADREARLLRRIDQLQAHIDHLQRQVASLTGIVENR